MDSTEASSPDLLFRNFNQAMKDQVWLHHRLYLKLFAGPGKCLIRESNREDLGSPLKVLEKNFTDSSLWK